MYQEQDFLPPKSFFRLVGKQESFVLYMPLFPLPTQSEKDEDITLYRDHIIMLAVWWRMSEALSLSAVTC